MSSGPSPSKKAKTVAPGSLMASVKPWETLGSCFDVDFSKPSFVSIGPSIFDLGESDLTMVPRPQADSKITTVSSDEKVSDKFSTSVKISASFGCFGGSASMGIDKSSSMTKHTTRTDVTNECTKWKVSGTTRFMVEPHTYLNAQLQEYIHDGDISMEALEKVIGTFYCREFHLGGIFKRSYIVEKSETDTKSSVEASLKASFGGALVKADAEFSLGKQKAKNNKNASMRIEESILGGNTAIWLGNTATKSKETLEAWAASINDTNLHPLGMELEFTWTLVEAINPTLGESYKQYLQKKWEEQSISGTPSEYVKEEKPPPFFHLKNGNGHYLAVSGNNLSKGVCVWSKNTEAGQLWIWEGKKIRSKLGAKYLSVSQNSGSRGSEVILWSAKDIAGQQWALKKDGHLQNEKGLFLAVNGNGGRGSRLCQWSSKDQGGQLWEQIDSKDHV